MRNVLLTIILLSIFFSCKKDIESNTSSNNTIQLSTVYIDPNSAIIQVKSELQIQSNEKWGVCYSIINDQPTITDSIIYSGLDSISNQQFYLYSLISNTQYFLRVFIESDSKVEYFDVYKFNTPKSVGASVEISHLPITAIGMDSAVLNLDFNNASNSDIKELGFCIAKKPQPNILDRKLKVNNTAGKQSSKLYKLTPSTFYYVRPYIITNAGTFYGIQRPFVTDSLIMNSEHGAGRIFYVYKKGEIHYVEGEFHGLVYKQLNKSFPWSIDFRVLNITDTTWGMGESNTRKIIDQLGSGNYAAYYIDTVKYGGYDNWFMPNISEVKKIYENFGAVHSSWISNEFGADSAYIARGAYKLSKFNKKGLRNVLIVRRF